MLVCMGICNESVSFVCRLQPSPAEPVSISKHPVTRLPMRANYSLPNKKNRNPSLGLNVR